VQAARAVGAAASGAAPAQEGSPARTWLLVALAGIVVAAAGVAARRRGAR
jgi:hypothetical protein